MRVVRRRRVDAALQCREVQAAVAADDELAVHDRAGGELLDEAGGDLWEVAGEGPLPSRLQEGLLGGAEPEAPEPVELRLEHRNARPDRCQAASRTSSRADSSSAIAVCLSTGSLAGSCRGSRDGPSYVLRHAERTPD